jgi:hypothetical protein
MRQKSRRTPQYAKHNTRFHLTRAFDSPKLVIFTERILGERGSQEKTERQKGETMRVE